LHPLVPLRELPVLREDALQGASRGGFQRECLGCLWDPEAGFWPDGDPSAMFRKSRMRQGVGGKA
jgi:hypothetical protein